MKKLLIVLIIILVVGVAGYGIYYQLQNNKTNTEVKNNEEKKEGETLETNSDVVKLSMNKLSILNDSLVASEFMGYLYMNDSYTVDSIDNEVKLLLATEQLYSKNNKFKSNTFPITITKSEMQAEIQDIFGPNVTYTDSNITLNCKTVGVYDASTQTYSFTEPDGCGGVFIPEIDTKIISATKYDDKLEIVEKMAYLDYKEDSTGNFVQNVHKNVSDKNVIGTLSENNTDVFSLYSDKLDSYKYTFKYKNGNYYFDSIKKVS